MGEKLKVLTNWGYLHHQGSRFARLSFLPRCEDPSCRLEEILMPELRISAQAECFWSVERGWVREAAVDFLPGSSVAQRSWRVTGHSAFTTRVLPMLLAQSKHWGVQMAEAPIPLLLGTN